LGCYGDGGAIFTNDDNLAHKIRGIVNHGMYERYHHDVVGVNSRLDSIQAAILNAKLPHLNSYNKARQTAARSYTSALSNIKDLLTPNGGKLCSTICDNCDCHVFHQYTLRILNNKRDGLAKYLSDLNIPFGIYYPIPLHKQKAYQDSRYIEDDFRNTNLLCKEVISLPMHTELDEDQINFICEKIRDFLE
jgi:dTDP-4-amino-4,6-dideoxygalactose transaminase